jgi:hypothetical protein
MNFTGIAVCWYEAASMYCILACAQASYCVACECWVPAAAGGSGCGREEAWQRHVEGARHRRQAAARAQAEASRDATHYYRSACPPTDFLCMTLCVWDDL